jgi:hypothetical protein
MKEFPKCFNVIEEDKLDYLIQYSKQLNYDYAEFKNAFYLAKGNKWIDTDEMIDEAIYNSYAIDLIDCASITKKYHCNNLCLICEMNKDHVNKNMIHEKNIIAYILNEDRNTEVLKKINLEPDTFKSLDLFKSIHTYPVLKEMFNQLATKGIIEKEKFPSYVVEVLDNYLESLKSIHVTEEEFLLSVNILKEEKNSKDEIINEVSAIIVNKSDPSIASFVGDLGQLHFLEDKSPKNKIKKNSALLKKINRVSNRNNELEGHQEVSVKGQTQILELIEQKTEDAQHSSDEAYNEYNKKNTVIVERLPNEEDKLELENKQATQQCIEEDNERIEEKQVNENEISEVENEENKENNNLDNEYAIEQHIEKLNSTNIENEEEIEGKVNDQYIPIADEEDFKTYFYDVLCSEYIYIQYIEFSQEIILFVKSIDKPVCISINNKKILKSLMLIMNEELKVKITFNALPLIFEFSKLGIEINNLFDIQLAYKIWKWPIKEERFYDYMIKELTGFNIKSSNIKNMYIEGITKYKSIYKTFISKHLNSKYKELYSNELYFYKLLGKSYFVNMGSHISPIPLFKKSEWGMEYTFSGKIPRKEDISNTKKIMIAKYNDLRTFIKNTLDSEKVEGVTAAGYSYKLNEQYTFENLVDDIVHQIMKYSLIKLVQRKGVFDTSLQILSMNNDDFIMILDEEDKISIFDALNQSMVLSVKELFPQYKPNIKIKTI